MGCLASRFGSTRHGRPSNGGFSSCARSTRTHGREVFGYTGLAPTSRSESVRVEQRCVGWKSAKPDDTWPDTWPGPRRRGNCPVAPACSSGPQLDNCRFAKADPVAFSFAQGQNPSATRAAVPCRRALRSCEKFRPLQRRKATTSLKQRGRRRAARQSREPLGRIGLSTS